jgi:hypothetical protein
MIRPPSHVTHSKIMDSPRWFPFLQVLAHHVIM